MALVQTEVKLNDIGKTLDVQIFFPHDRPEWEGDINGVITLLHGMSNTGYDWMTMTSAPRYAAETGYILVAPQADNSFYHNMQHGTPFEAVFTYLLPYHLEKLFNIPTERAKNFIAGNSMGGYGALMLALNHPERYAAAGSFSGSLDIHKMTRILVEEMGALPLMQALWGTDLTIPPEADLVHLAEQTAALPMAERPRLMCTCGEQDESADIYKQNFEIAEKIQHLGVACPLYSWQGVHEWNFWDRSLTEFISFIDGKDYAEKKRRKWTAPIEYS